MTATASLQDDAVRETDIDSAKRPPWDGRKQTFMFLVEVSWRSAASCAFPSHPLFPFDAAVLGQKRGSRGLLQGRRRRPLFQGPLLAVSGRAAEITLGLVYGTCGVDGGWNQGQLYTTRARRFNRQGYRHDRAGAKQPLTRRIETSSGSTDGGIAPPACPEPTSRRPHDQVSKFWLPACVGRVA